MKFIKLEYMAFPTTEWRHNTERENQAYLFARLCNRCEETGKCTVGFLPCPFLLDNELPHNVGALCAHIKPEDWLRHLEVM